MTSPARTVAGGASAAPAVVRRRIRVRGIVQGVGFRPFVYRTAVALGLVGHVRNDGEGVTIDAQGPPAALDALLAKLRPDAPPLAQVDSVEVLAEPRPHAHVRGFTVVASAATRTATAIGADAGVCDACLEELFTPGDRRYRYALTNCTDCGPRYTVTRRLPYDREQTSLEPFPLCPDCAAEYVAPDNRRFSAEATACPACGPTLRLVEAAADAAAPHGSAHDSGRDVRAADGAAAARTAADPLARAAELLGAGAILALKGLGGYHLACDARNRDAVARLRARKYREEQPFAIMALNTESLEPFVEVLAAERAALESPDRPIVLLPRQHGAANALPGVADGLGQLGVMLPYTPLHYLLLHELAGCPEGTAWLRRREPALLVMTSANVHGDPLVIDDSQAVSILAGIADAWLLHDREIVARCDDSVVRVRSGRVRYVRRARGAAPRPLRLSGAAPPVLGVGGHFKATVCLTRDDQAFLSPHVGDLDAPATRHALDEAVEHLLRLVDVRPQAIAHDLHPDFHSTRLAARLAQAWGVPAVPVQHHHAHVAAVMAEHQVEGPILGLALDGIGHGTDGTAWGGELLLVDAGGSTRLGHLRRLPLPGGDRATQEPWRMAAAVLHALGRADEIPTRFAAQPAAPTVAALLARGERMPLTSSTGRWFDAAAGLLGLKPVTTYEGQAAMLLEGLAAAAGDSVPAEARHLLADDGMLDLLPLLASIERAGDPIAAAARFHSGLALALADWVAAAAARTGLARVACGGGCFLNHVLSRRLRSELATRGIEMLEAETVPPNDGGLSLGQCWVARRVTASVGPGATGRS